VQQDSGVHSEKGPSKDQTKVKQTRGQWQESATLMVTRTLDRKVETVLQEATA
jgi:hypothetical protein